MKVSSSASILWEPVEAPMRVDARLPIWDVLRYVSHCPTWEVF